MIPTYIFNLLFISIKTTHICRNQVTLNGGMDEIVNSLSKLNLSNSDSTYKSNAEDEKEDWSLRPTLTLGRESIAFWSVSKIDACGCGHDHNKKSSNHDGDNIAVVDCLSKLDVIKKQEVKMAVWQREDIPNFVNALNDSAATLKDLPHFQGLVTRKETSSQLRKHLLCSCPDTHGYFSKDIIDALIEDIDTLVFAFADISKSDNIYVKLKKVDCDQCKFWHQDSVDFRLVTTYRGPCTEFVQPEYSLETLKNKREDSKYTQSLSLRDVALFKGQGQDDLVETDGTNKQEGIVHRSPRIEKERGVFRLLLVLDIPQAGWHY